MTQGFDKDYWESHWQQASEHSAGRDGAPNPYLARETSDLAPGEALDAGCGEGAEAIWLAAAGWQVTAADISTEVLARATDRAARIGAAAGSVHWVEADSAVGNRVGSSISLPPTTRTLRCRNWSSNNASQGGWRPAAHC